MAEVIAETATEGTTERAWKLTDKATGELVGYAIAGDLVPAKTLNATECGLEEARAWEAEHAVQEEAEAECGAE